MVRELGPDTEVLAGPQALLTLSMGISKIQMMSEVVAERLAVDVAAAVAGSRAWWPRVFHSTERFERMEASLTVLLPAAAEGEYGLMSVQFQEVALSVRTEVRLQRRAEVAAGADESLFPFRMQLSILET